ncbi:Twin-arginine translocation protein TatA [hydrothermal vent metagenome]|uniref:Twin-arginine translocation protein TatA n=1 Tax=hydrothermal vent metagenome TaxID=652676 RepID=A0A3B1BTE1_9ZZZZ
MFGIGMPELIVILVILLIVFGASRLPEIGAGLGKGIKNFKKSVTETEKGLSASADESKDQAEEKEKTS